MTKIKTIVMPQEVFCFMASVVDMATIVTMMSREQMELFHSRIFRVFLNAQKDATRFVTHDTKHYELLVVLLSGLSKEDIETLFAELMESAEVDWNENDYLFMCGFLKTMWQNLEMLRQEIIVHDIQEVKFNDKELHILLKDD